MQIGFTDLLPLPQQLNGRTDIGTQAFLLQTFCFLQNITLSVRKQFPTISESFICFLLLFAILESRHMNLQ